MVVALSRRHSLGHLVRLSLHVFPTLSCAVGQTLRAVNCSLGSVASETGEGELSTSVAWYVSASKSNYRVLNRYLRSGRQPQQPDLEKRVLAIDTLIAASPLQSVSTQVFRGFSSWSFATEVRVGDRVRDLAYMSASLNRSVANFYARRDVVVAEDLENSVLLELTVPASARLMRVACSKTTTDEEEVLLPRETEFQVESEQLWRGVRVLQCTVLVPQIP